MSTDGDGGGAGGEWSWECAGAYGVSVCFDAEGTVTDVWETYSPTSTYHAVYTNVLVGDTRGNPPGRGICWN
jgi:hypothetical protein